MGASLCGALCESVAFGWEPGGCGSQTCCARRLKNNEVEKDGLTLVSWRGPNVSSDGGMDSVLTSSKPLKMFSTLLSRFLLNV